MSSSAASLNQSEIGELADFLHRAFAASSTSTDAWDREVLRWKFFDPRGDSQRPRSLVIRDQEGKIAAHVGICTTGICSNGPGSESVPAVHITDWYAGEGGVLGAALLLECFQPGNVEYALGATASSRRVLLAAGFKELAVVPLFHKILRRLKPGCWREIHGRQTWWRQLGFFGLDFVQSLSAVARPNRNGTVIAKPVKEFGPEIVEIAGRCTLPITFSSRHPTILNHYLRYPKKTISGWLLERQGRPCGFGLLSRVTKPDLSIGRIVDCFLEGPDPTAWRDAVGCLEGQLFDMDCDLVSCFASAPWLMRALRQSGYFRRGRAPFYLRNRQKRVVPQQALHVSHLEADLAYI